MLHKIIPRKPYECFSTLNDICYEVYSKQLRIQGWHSEHHEYFKKASLEACNSVWKSVWSFRLHGEPWALTTYNRGCKATLTTRQPLIFPLWITSSFISRRRRIRNHCETFPYRATSFILQNFLMKMILQIWKPNFSAWNRNKFPWLHHLLKKLSNLNSMF